MAKKQLMIKLMTGLLVSSVGAIMVPNMAWSQNIKDNERICKENGSNDDDDACLERNFPIKYGTSDVYDLIHYLHSWRIAEKNEKELALEGISLSLIDFDTFNYEQFHDRVLLFLSQWIQLEGPQYSGWKISEDGGTYKNTQEMETFLNYYILRLFLQSGSKHMVKNSVGNYDIVKSIDTLDSDYVARHYKSATYYILTHLKKEDGPILDAIMNRSDRMPDKMVASLHEPLALYGRYRPHTIVIKTYINHSFPYRDIHSAWNPNVSRYDTKANALKAIQIMMSYHNADIETSEFKNKARDLFRRYPYSLTGLMRENVFTYLPAPYSHDRGQSLDDLVLPAFLNIGNGNKVEVSGKSLIVKTTQDTQGIWAPPWVPVTLINDDYKVNVSSTNDFLSCSVNQNKENTRNIDIMLEKNLIYVSNDGGVCGND